MSNTDVESATAFSKRVYEATQKTIEAMQDGERMQIKQLAQVVGQAVAKESKVVLGFVNYFAHENKLAYVTRGKNGGIIKGVKPVKVVKVSKRPKKIVDSTTVDTDTSSV